MLLIDCKLCGEEFRDIILLDYCPKCEVKQRVTTTPQPLGMSGIEEYQRMERNIGMLRQWLNEDRIKDASRFVTNEDIKHWLELPL